MTDEDHVSGVKELALALGLKRAGEIDTAEKADRVLEVIQGRLIQAQQDVMTGLVKPRKGEAEAWGELFSPENLAKLSSSDWVKLEAIISRGNVEMVKQEGYGFVSGLVGIFGMEKVANALGIKNPALHFITVVGGSHVLSSQLVPHLLSADKFQALVKFAKAGPKTWFLGAAKELISTNWARFSLSLAKGIVHFGVAMQVYDRITRLLNVQDTAAGGAFGRLLGGQTVMSAVHVTWGMALRFAMTRLGASAARLAQSGGGAAAEALTGAYLTATVVDFIKSKVTYEGSLDAASGNDPLVRSRLVEERVKGADDAWQTVRETVRRRLLTQAVAKVNDAHTDASYFQGVSLKDFDLDGLKADLTSTVTLTAADQAIMDFIPEYLKANPKASQENVVAALAERFTSNEETVAASLHRIAVYQLQQNLAFVYETDPTGRHIHEAERQMLNSDGTVKPEMFEGFMTRMVGELKQSREADIVTLRRRVRVETLMTEEHAGSTHFTRADMEAGLVDGSTLGLNLRHGWVVDFQSFQYAELKKEAAQLGAKTALTAAEQNRLSQIKVALTAREIQIIQLRRRFLMTGDAGAQIDLESLGDDLKWLENKPYVAHLKQMGEKIALAEKMPEHVRAVYLAGLLEQLAGK